MAKNSISGIICQVMTALVAAILLPINLHYLGKEAYSISVLATSFLVVLSIISAGLGPTLVRFFSKCFAENDEQYFCRLLSTSFYLLSFLGLIGFSVLVIGIPFFISYYEVPESLTQVTSYFFFMLACSFVLTFPAIAYTAILSSLNRYDRINIITIISYLIKLLLVLFFYSLFSPSLFFLGLAVFLGSVIQFSSLCFFCHKYLGQMMIPKFNRFDYRIIYTLYSFSLLMLLIIFSSSLVYKMSIILSGKYIDLFAAGIMAPIIMIVLNVEGLLTRSVNTLTPRASRELVENQGKNLAWLSIQSHKILVTFSTLFYLILWFAGKQFITLWLGTKMMEDIFLPLMILFPALFFTQRANLYLLLGTYPIGRYACYFCLSNILAIAIIAFGMIYAAFSIVMVAFVLSISLIIRDYVISNWYFSKIFHYSVWSFNVNVYFIPLFCLIAIFAIDGFLVCYLWGTYSKVFCVVLLRLFLFGTAYFLVIYKYHLPEAVKNLVRQKMKVILRLKSV